MLAGCSAAGSFEKLSGGRQRGQKDTNSFFRSGTIGDWKNHLDPSIAHRCCMQVEPLMKHFGYTIDPIVQATVFVGAKTPDAAAA